MGVGEPFGDDDLRHCERQRRVGAGLDGDPSVGVNRRGIEVGADGDDAGAVVPGLGQKVEVRDLRVRRVAAPDEDEVGVEEVVGGPARDRDAERDSRPLLLVADFGVEIEHDGPEQIRKPVDGDPRSNTGRVAIEDDRVRRAALQVVDDAVGDLGQRLVPGDLLPLALAALACALQRMGQAQAVRHRERVARALLAAARVEVRDGCVGLRIGARRLLVDNGAILHKDVVRAAALIPAVHQVRALRHAVPLPSLAVRVGGGWTPLFFL